MTPMERDVRHHFARVWAARNDESVHVFANGHRYDRAARRRGVRQMVEMVRRDRKRVA